MKVGRQGGKNGDMNNSGGGLAGIQEEHGRAGYTMCLSLELMAHTYFRQVVGPKSTAKCQDCLKGAAVLCEKDTVFLGVSNPPSHQLPQNLTPVQGCLVLSTCLPVQQSSSRHADI